MQESQLEPVRHVIDAMQQALASMPDQTCTAELMRDIKEAIRTVDDFELCILRPALGHQLSTHEVASASARSYARMSSSGQVCALCQHCINSPNTRWVRLGLVLHAYASAGLAASNAHSGLRYCMRVTDEAYPIRVCRRHNISGIIYGSTALQSCDWHAT